MLLVWITRLIFENPAHGILREPDLTHIKRMHCHLKGWYWWINSTQDVFDWMSRIMFPWTRDTFQGTYSIRATRFWTLEQIDEERNATLDASYMHDCQEGMAKLMMLWLNADFLSLCTDDWIDADEIRWSGLIPRMNEVDIKDLTCWLSNTCKICCQFNLLVVEHCENVMLNEWLRLQHWHLFDLFVTVCLCMTLYEKNPTTTYGFSDVSQWSCDQHGLWLTIFWLASWLQLIVMRCKGLLVIPFVTQQWWAAPSGIWGSTCPFVQYSGSLPKLLW